MLLETYDNLYKRPHNLPLSGKGVVLGIIDQPLWLDHPCYAGKIIDYVDASNMPNFSMHGASVTSIAVGDEIGVAPSAKVVYRAIRTWNGREDLLRNHLEALKTLYAYAEAGNPLHAISSSHAWNYKKDILSLCQENEALIALFETKGIPVFMAGDDVFGVGGPNGHAALVNQAGQEENTNRGLCIPIDDRLLACRMPEQMEDNGDNPFYRCVGGGHSWAAPYVAGCFALAREANPTISRIAFHHTLKKTARQIDIDGTKYPFPDLRAFCEEVKLSHENSRGPLQEKKKSLAPQ